MSTTDIIHCTRSHTFGTIGLALIASLVVLGGCDEGSISQPNQPGQPGDVNVTRALGIAPGLAQTSCDPTMSVFPIAAAHNIGSDQGSCAMGICDLTCPDANANISPEGVFNSDIDPFELLSTTSPTACDGDEPAARGEAVRAG